MEFFLNSLIAQIKIGSGFRQAFKLAASTIQKTTIQNCFLEVLESILLKKPLREELNFPPVKQTLEELKLADQSSQCLEHLENLRWQVRARGQFNKKVKTALMQVRVQSFVLLVLYLSLFGFILSRYGFKYPKVLLGSLFLFSLGLFFLLRTGGKIKWNI